MTPFQPKPRHCKQCEALFTPARPLAYICSPSCAAKYVKATKAAEKQQTKARKEAIKTHAEWKADAQKAVNDYVRLRDAHLPCISCGRFHEGAWHAGHFRSRGAAPQLALDPRNVHRQCAPCNLYLHGNPIAYRAGLVERYGVEYVEAIESENEPLKLTVDELRQLKTIYRAKARDLKRSS
jgi:hypothetical protein